MNKIVHTQFFKNMLLTLVIVMSGLFVYAGFDYNSFGYQVKIVKCYPSPATSVINFEFTSTGDKTNTLRIYSFTGKKMTDQVVTSGKVSVLLGNDFYRGIYFFQLCDKNGKIIETGKFQVVK
ncbi:MAG TPA: T9SS type A sorting domain-containing protein [Panacibacter sp.]|nr:T9SS type A sorting domain-containing protein [Panacibacter sp.]